MKKLLAISGLLLFAICGYSQGQNGVIRPAIYPPSDGSGRSINYVQITTPTILASADTISLYPYGGVNIVQPSDSLLRRVIYVIKSSPTNYAGDQLKFIIAGSKLPLHDTVLFRNKYTTSFKFRKDGAVDSTVVFVGGKYLIADFTYNGTYWLQNSIDTVSK